MSAVVSIRKIDRMIRTNKPHYLLSNIVCKINIWNSHVQFREIAFSIKKTSIEVNILNDKDLIEYVYSDIKLSGVR